MALVPLSSAGNRWQPSGASRRPTSSPRVARCRANTPASRPSPGGAEASWKCRQVSRTVKRWSQTGNNGCYVLDLTAVNMEWWRPDGADLTGPLHHRDRDGRYGLMSEMAIGPSLSFSFLGVDAGGIRLERLLARGKGLLGRRPAVRAEDVAVGHLGEPVPQLNQVDLVLL